MYVIGTAGHVDHGKSLLVEALTGIDPDRLREEKARGMTIDLGFAWLTLPSGRTVSIVDVPGHERFIKNMLAGAGGVDLALLVVAADDGVMPQTREHLAILDLLGVRRGVVALTKVDLAETAWLDLVEMEIRELLEPTTLAGSEVIRCSAVHGDGLAELCDALDDAVTAMPRPKDIGRPRLPVDRVFTIDGFGTVVTGTLIDGELHAGEEVEILPAGRRARVRALQSHRQSVTAALPGTRTAVNLSGVEKEAVRRGMVLAHPGSASSVRTIDGQVTAVRGLRRPLPHNARLTFHCFAAESPVTLRLLDREELRDGETCWAQLRLDEPLVAARGDRFVLRTPGETVGGGVVVDAAARRHRRGDPAVLLALAAALSASPIDRVREALATGRVANVREIAAAAVITEREATEHIASLCAADEARRVGAEGVVAVAAIRRFETVAREALASFHAAHSLRAGMPLEELRERLGLAPRSFAEIAPLLSGVVVERGHARAEAFGRRLSPAQRNEADRWLASLTGLGATPGLEIDPDLRAFLVEGGEAIDAGGGICFTAASFSAMTEQVRRHIAEEGSITLARARDLLDTSRKYAQAFLEELDRSGVTRRAGDERVLRQKTDVARDARRPVDEEPNRDPRRASRGAGE